MTVTSKCCLHVAFILFVVDFPKKANELEINKKNKSRKGDIDK